jgi:hypothetical protein
MAKLKEILFRSVSGIGFQNPENKIVLWVYGNSLKKIQPNRRYQIHNQSLIKQFVNCGNGLPVWIFCVVFWKKSKLFITFGPCNFILLTLWFDGISIWTRTLV